MNKANLLLLGTICLLTSCSTGLRTLRENAMKVTSYQTSLRKSIQSFDKTKYTQDTLVVKPLQLLTCETWQSDRNEFVGIIKDYKDKNEVVRSKSGKTGTFFTVAGTIVGSGGGIYGLFSNSEPKGAAVTSLVAGALTALVGSLNLQKKAERADACSKLLEGTILDFQARWGIARCPRNEEELQQYLKAKDEIIERLKTIECYGLPASSN